MLRFISLIACLCVSLSAAELDQTRISTFANDLIAIGDRSPGSTGAATAADAIAHELEALGLTVVRSRSTIAGSLNLGSQLTVGASTIRLTPHRRNRAAISTTAGQDVTGTLIVLGDGAADRVNGLDIRGSLIVLDGNTGKKEWLNAAQLGAAAIIFRNPDQMSRWNVEMQGAGASIDVPRFVAMDPIPDQLNGQSATLNATVTLEPLTAETLIASIPGTGNHTEAVLLATGYESPALMPGLTPGAIQAWNTATLLESARMLKAQPTIRDAVVIFHGGALEHFRGLRHLVATLCLDRTTSGYDALSQMDQLAVTQTLSAWRGQALSSAFTEALTRDHISMHDLGELVAGRLVKAPVDGVNLDDQKILAIKSCNNFIALLAGQIADDLQPGLEKLRGKFAPKFRKTMSDDEQTALKAEIDAAETYYQRYRTIQQKLDYEQPLDASEDDVIRELVAQGAGELGRHLSIVERYRDDYQSMLRARTVLGTAAPIHLIGLDLSDGNRHFGAAVKGTYVSWLEELGWLTSGLVKLADDLNKQAGSIPIAFERAAHDSQDEVDAWFGADYIHEAGVAGLYIPASTISTVADQRLRQGSPQDTAANVKVANLTAQITGLGGFIAAYIDAPFIANRKAKNIASKSPQIEVQVRSIGSKTGYRGYPYPLTFTQRDKNKDWLGGIGWEESYWGDAFGMCRVPYVPERHPKLSGGTPVSIYGLDNNSQIIAALASAGTMKIKGGSEGFAKDQVTDILPLIFRCERSSLFGIFDPRLLIPLSTVSVLSATRDSAPNFYHVENSPALAAAAIFTEPEVPLRITATQGQVGNRLIITGHASNSDAGATTPKAIAAGLHSGQLSLHTAFDAAEDTFRLNDERLALLRHNGINPDSLVSLHSQTERHLESARTALEAKDYDTAQGQSQTAWAMAGRVYPNVLGTANDVVYGLVVMLLFAIPFAWICERLFVSAGTIARKVIGFMSFFVVIFLFFYFFHPAFQLATTPMVIFLAFIILIMSSWVIGLLYNRFEFEMEQIRMAGMGLHKADVSRLGTLLATVGLGISNMRRRPTRTFLTALTVVLMTFILLTFASFNPSVGSQRLGQDVTPPYSGILVRQSGWLDMSDFAKERVRRISKDAFDIHEVRWLAPGASQPKFPIVGPKAIGDVAGLVGIEANDPTGIESALLRGTGEHAPRGLSDDAEWLFLPKDVLERIGANIGDPVIFRGMTFTAGLIDQGRLSSLTQLGGDPLTPLAYDATEQNRQDDDARLAALASEGGPAEENSAAIHISPAAVGIGRAATLERLGASLRGIALNPHNRSVDIAAEAETIAKQLAVTLRVGTAGESYLLTSVGRMSVAGLGAVLIPLILGGLIIFSTMLNSVAERGKEIFIFSSLGLAPIHVAALFLVEAAIYAILGGLGGYMLAQLIISGLGFAADLGYGVRPDINYSSFTAVATILLVMATVLASALYPAWMASKAANPGTIDFRVPEPDGDHLDIAFPFTVAARDVRGLCAFLTRYFDTNTEAAGGCFTAADAAMDFEKTNYAVSSKIWLAPFDLGISQHFRMTCKPTDVRAIFSVHLELDLLSGQRSAWRRTNLAFLKDLRQQFLVWRTLAPETMDQYRADGGDEDAIQRIAARAARTPGADSSALPVAGGTT